MGIRHVAVLTLSDDATDEQRQAVLDGLRALPAAIPEILSYSFGFDAGLGAGNGSFAVVADFDSEDDYQVYANHPEHQRFIAEALRPVLAGRAAVQYVVA